MVCTLVVGFFTCFELDGFSGEMLPLFRYRFGDRPQLKKLKSGLSDASSLQAVERSDTSHALADSSQFLGSNRNGVIDKREFAIPKSAGELQVLWDQGIGEGWASFAVAGSRAITLEQRGESESITCYRLSDGDLPLEPIAQCVPLPPARGAGPRSTPTIVGKKVYALGSTGRLCCIDLETGNLIWKTDLLELAEWTQEESESAIAWGRANSPLIVDGLCVVPLGSPVDLNNPGKGARSLVALDAESGEVRWTSGSDQISYASPTVLTLGGQRQIVSVNEKTITGHAIESGQQLWSFDWPGASNSNASCSSALAAGENRFVIGKGYGGGSAVVNVTSKKTSG